MAGTDIMTHSGVILRPDPARTVIRPFVPGDPPDFAVKGHTRAQRIADRVLALDASQRRQEYMRVSASLDQRHRDVEDLLMRRYDEVNGDMIECGDVGRDQALLIGAYFCEEYSFESAALFNPSMVAVADQSGLPPGSVRFAMSLRGIGEGHVSSVTFRTGTWGPDGFAVDPPSATAVAPMIEDEDKDVIHLQCGGSRELSETVLFPVTPSQRQGIEDMRLVRFVEDDGTVRYLGTYTAYSGMEARSELLEAHDFRSFDMRAMTGSASGGKGMALFPRKIGGRYTMLGRHDNENVWLLQSDDLTHWEGGDRIITPKQSWEIVQMGNCGSPIEIDEGWLVLTHGVGTVRNYCIGASLLDRDDPSKLLARTALPLVHPSPKERDGYVPNVVYSCGGMVHERTLLLPYGVADSFATFASVAVDDLLAMLS